MGVIVREGECPTFWSATATEYAVVHTLTAIYLWMVTSFVSQSSRMDDATRSGLLW